MAVEQKAGSGAQCLRWLRMEHLGLLLLSTLHESSLINMMILRGSFFVQFQRQIVVSGRIKIRKLVNESEHVSDVLLEENAGRDAVLISE